MEFFGAIFLIIIGFIILLSIFYYRPAKKKTSLSKQEKDYYDLNYKYSSKGMNAKTSRKVKECLDILEKNYPGDNNISFAVSRKVFREDLNDLHEYYDSLAREEWEAKASKILDRFLDLYIIITDPDFRDVEKAYRSKNRCIKYWQDYFASQPDGVYDPPKEFMRNYLGDEFDVCMYSHESLEKKLTECIVRMKPEYQRKMDLIKQMISIVSEKENGLMRAELFRKVQGDYSEAEVKYCYKELIEKYRLSEVKIGGRFFTYLSEKEKQKSERRNMGKGARLETAVRHDQPSEKEIVPLNSESVAVENCVETIPEVICKILPSSYNRMDDLIQTLRENDIEYTDLRNIGGNLWIVSSSDADDSLSKLRVKDDSLRYAKATKVFDGRPGWYIK